MTALRFQTGGRHQTSPASLRGTNTVRESALEVVHGRKFPCRFGESNPRQQCSRPVGLPPELHPHPVAVSFLAVWGEKGGDRITRQSPQSTISEEKTKPQRTQTWVRALTSQTSGHWAKPSHTCGVQPEAFSAVQFSSVQLNPLTDWVVGGT